MASFQFMDHLISYDTFINDLSARIVRLLKSDNNDPEFISQRKAYELFGRRNVERWKQQGKVVSYKRPGKVEYRTADLRLLQRTTQDYFNWVANSITIGICSVYRQTGIFIIKCL